MGKILIENQMFGNADREHNIFNFKFQAIVGLAYPELAEEGVTPVFDNMMDQNLLKQSLFAFYLGEVYLNEESELTFGYYDKTKFTGEL